MAEVLVVGEVLGLVVEIGGLLASARERIESALQNPHKARQLISLFQHIEAELTPLTDECENNDLKFSDRHLRIFNHRIHRLHTLIKDSFDDLHKITRKLHNPIRRFVRSRATSEVLREIETNARQAEQLVFDITACFATGKSISKTTAAVSENTIATADAIKSLAAAAKVEKERRCGGDAFEPCFDVPENPAHVLLKFQAVSDAEELCPDDCTPETKLKWMLMQPEDTQNIEHGRLPLPVGVEGMSGAGKSCALRGIVKDSEILDRFRDGTYFTQLGKDATEATLILELARIVKRSGGLEISREMMEESSVEQAAVIAKRWFRGKCMLLLIDDVWDIIGCDVVAQMSRVVDLSSGSRVAFSSRNARIAAKGKAVHFPKRDAEASLEILLLAGRMRAGDVGSFQDVVDDVLQLCDGLPMALAVTGSNLRMRLRAAAGSTAEEVWSEYLVGLQAHREYLLHRVVDEEIYGNLSSAFTASLSMLDESMNKRLPFECRKKFSEMYRSLSILQPQGWLPLHVLGRLWETEDNHETVEVIQVFVDANMGRREDRLLDGTKIPGLAVHDLQLNFIWDACKTLGEEKKFHQELLNSYLSEICSDCTSIEAPCHHWSDEIVFLDAYMRNNVCRHLLHAGLEEELRNLLTDPRWAAKKLRVNEFIGLEDDFQLVLRRQKRERRRKGSDLQSTPGSDEWSLEQIIGAARMSACFVSRNPKEVWFQLYARILPFSEYSRILQAYHGTIERCAEKPWVKALSPCFPETDVRQRTILLHGIADCISTGENNGEFRVSGTLRNGEVFSSTLANGMITKTEYLVTPAFIVEAATNRPGRICGSNHDGTSFIRVQIPMKSHVCETHLSFLQDAWELQRQFLAVGDAKPAMADKVVELLKSVTDAGSFTNGRSQFMEGLRRRLNYHGKAVRIGHGGWRDQSVAMSNDAKLIATGLEEGSMTVCGETSKLTAGCTSTYHEGDEIVEEYIRLSMDGIDLSPASEKGTVLVWNIQNGVHSNPLQLRGHAGDVRCVAWSPDSSMLASSSEDRTVRVWNIKTGGSECRILTGFRQPIGHLAWSPDGKRLATLGRSLCQVCDGSTEGYQIWNMECQTLEALRLHGNAELATCLTWSPDGKRIASGSGDGRVCLWHSGTGNLLGDTGPMDNHTITSIVWSADGITIATCSLEEKVVCWGVHDILMMQTEAEKCASRNIKNAKFESWQGHSGVISDVRFLADGRRFFSESTGGLARLWDSETHECLKERAVPVLFEGPAETFGERYDIVDDAAHSNEPDSFYNEAIVFHNGRWQSMRVRSAPTGKRLLTAAASHATRGPADNVIVDNPDISKYFKDREQVLRSFLGDDETLAEDNVQGEKEVEIDDARIAHKAKGEKVVLATLTHEVGCMYTWSYTPVTRKLVIGNPDGCLFLFQLVV